MAKIKYDSIDFYNTHVDIQLTYPEDLKSILCEHFRITPEQADELLDGKPVWRGETLLRINNHTITFIGGSNVREEKTDEL